MTPRHHRWHSASGRRNSRPFVDPKYDWRGRVPSRPPTRLARGRRRTGTRVSQGGNHSTYVLKVSDAARYLGLSRSALDKLVGAGKLRIATVRSQDRDEKSEKLIPAKDVLELKIAS